jgi:hypothetical protein
MTSPECRSLAPDLSRFAKNRRRRDFCFGPPTRSPLRTRIVIPVTCSPRSSGAIYEPARANSPSAFTLGIREFPGLQRRRRSHEATSQNRSCQSLGKQSRRQTFNSSPLISCLFGSTHSPTTAGRVSPLTPPKRKPLIFRVPDPSVLEGSGFTRYTFDHHSKVRPPNHFGQFRA